MTGRAYPAERAKCEFHLQTWSNLRAVQTFNCRSIIAGNRMTQIQAVAPVLLVRDVVASANYFRDKLGFSYDRFWNEQLNLTKWQQLSRHKSIKFVYYHMTWFGNEFPPSQRFPEGSFGQADPSTYHFVARLDMQSLPQLHRNPYMEVKIRWKEHLLLIEAYF